MSELTPQKVPLRPASEVMRLARMGQSFPMRLSFLRVLTRKLQEERAEVTRPIWNIDANGFGHAVYSVTLGGHVYSLVAFANPLADEDRTDRVIAEAWDAAFVLYDGVPDADEIARLGVNAPLQEAGRFTERDLILSRANKSVRLFAHVVERLRCGQQPDAEMIRNTGYLMRTTAVYGNGKFGIADRVSIAERPGLSGPFMAEMLTVWLIRGFTHDLAEFLGGAEIDRDLKRHLGIGNATGLGMAPFLVSHPELLNNWVMARETALARVRALGALDDTQVAEIVALAERAKAHLNEWQVPDTDAACDLDQVREDWADLLPELENILRQPQPIDQLVRVSQAFSLGCQELVSALVLEPFGDLVDGFAECMSSPRALGLDPRMSVETLASLTNDHCSWARSCNFAQPQEEARFWYVSEEKQEPRIGWRDDEPGADLERPLDTARQIKAMYADLTSWDGDLCGFLRRFPDHRGAVLRVQRLARLPYAEIQDNLIAKTCRPIDMLRFKLAFFGAAKFDPKSELWTRITLAQGAPLRDELDSAAEWWLPSLDR